MITKDVTCSPPEANNRSLTVKVIDYTPDKFFCFIKVPLIYSGIVVAGILVSLMISLPCYKYRWYISHCRVVVSAVIDEMREVKFEEHCVYDALVSYNTQSEEDTRWVVENLVPGIEHEDVVEINKQNDKLKLFIADRDSEPGANTFTELCETLENSRKIIILLTKSYLSNPVCVRQAEILAGKSEVHQPNRFLVLILEELNEEIIKSPFNLFLAADTMVIAVYDSKSKTCWISEAPPTNNTSGVLPSGDSKLYQQVCPARWTRNPINSTCLFFDFENKYTREDSQAKCEEFGANLIELDSEEVFDWYISLRDNWPELDTCHRSYTCIMSVKTMMLSVISTALLIGCIQAYAQNPVDICFLDKKVGPCEALILQYYYNHVSGQCEQFFYGGCRGNENRFK
ncbi:hypothetical protein EB796_019568 [Bugula neritina]|uniref:Uncharacterized protein n=1 Tax=Bugula neritina TaxID=10212 RepID=A0A7J7J917_BUGNE|nr:hypothetical protein EB796_019568 [Bugula neritina]